MWLRRLVLSIMILAIVAVTAFAIIINTNTAKERRAAQMLGTQAYEIVMTQQAP